MTGRSRLGTEFKVLGSLDAQLLLGFALLANPVARPFAQELLSAEQAAPGLGLGVLTLFQRLIHERTFNEHTRNFKDQEWNWA